MILPEGITRRLPMMTKHGILRAEAVLEVLGAIREGDPPWRGISGATCSADYRVKRALELLRRANLIAFNHFDGRGSWRLLLIDHGEVPRD